MYGVWTDECCPGNGGMLGHSQTAAAAKCPQRYNLGPFNVGDAVGHRLTRRQKLYGVERHPVLRVV